MTNGKHFNMNRYTVAHKHLPLGTEVCILNKDTGQTVIAKVTDRGPYSGQRIVDVSKAIADKLGFTEDGHVEVDIFVVKKTTIIAYRG